MRDQDNGQPVSGVLRIWLIFMMVVGSLAAVGNFMQFLSASSASRDADRNIASYLLILSAAGILNVIGAAVLLRRQQWGMALLGVGGIAAILIAFPIFGSGPVAISMAVGAVAGLWITLLLCSKAGILKL